MRELFCLLLFAFLTNFGADSASYSDCGSEYTLMEVDVQGCILSPCNFNIGQWYNVTSKFYTDRPSSRLESEVIIRILNVDNVVLTTPTEPCDGLTSGSCPVEAQHTYEYRAEVYVHPGLLPTRALVEWKLLNEERIQVVCFAFSVRLHEVETPTPNIKRNEISTPLRNYRQTKLQSYNKKN